MIFFFFFYIFKCSFIRRATFETRVRINSFPRMTNDFRIEYTREPTYEAFFAWLRSGEYGINVFSASACWIRFKFNLSDDNIPKCGCDSRLIIWPLRLICTPSNENETRPSRKAIVVTWEILHFQFSQTGCFHGVQNYWNSKNEFLRYLQTFAEFFFFIFFPNLHYSVNFPARPSNITKLTVYWISKKYCTDWTVFSNE